MDMTAIVPDLPALMPDAAVDDDSFSCCFRMEPREGEPLVGTADPGGGLNLRCGRASCQKEGSETDDAD